MLENVPAPVGEILQGVRAGFDRLVWADEAVGGPETITVQSSAFADGEPMPSRFTQDGDGVSPPVTWRGVAQGVCYLVLVIEDADSPTPEPFVHALVYDLPPKDGGLPEGALPSKGHEGQISTLGKNTLRHCEYLPPDPPTGHGPHRYVFQIYGLDHRPNLTRGPEKHDILHALRGHVIARGRLVGLYERPA